MSYTKRTKRSALSGVLIVLIAFSIATLPAVASQTASNVTVTFEPTELDIEAGEEATVPVVVEGTENGINSFSMEMALTNGTVGNVVSFEYNKSPDFGNSEIRAGNNSLQFAAAQGENIYNPADRLVLGNVTIAATTAGTTDIVINNAAVSDNNDTRYSVGTSPLSLTVTSPATATATETMTTTTETTSEEQTTAVTATDTTVQSTTEQQTTEQPTTAQSTPTETAPSTDTVTTSGSGPGFTALVAVLATFAVALLIGRRR